MCTSEFSRGSDSGKKKSKIKKKFITPTFRSVAPRLWIRARECNMHIYIDIYVHILTYMIHSCEDFCNSGKRLFVLTISAAISYNKMSYAIKDY